MRANRKVTPAASKTGAVQPGKGSAEVDGFISRLPQPQRAQVELLRRVILGADARVREGIKWNAPSFHCGEWFATFNLRAKGSVRLVFHRGAKTRPAGPPRYVPDPTDLLHWITDDRCLATFTGADDIAAKSAAFRRIVAAWVRRLSAEKD